MGPSSTTTTTTTRRRSTRNTRNSRTTTSSDLQKKNVMKKKQPLMMKKNIQQEKSSSTIIINNYSPCKDHQETNSLKRSISSNDEVELMENNNNINNICSTPKGEKYRIPEIKNCPPAPKKRRINISSSTSTSSNSSSSCSLRRNPVTFFAPPDLDLFFFLALGDNIQV